MENPFILMMIGMGTVFAVLLLVIFTGNCLIAFVNKFCPEQEKPVAKAASNNATINPNIAQAIALAVQQITNGKGKVEKIEKK